MAPKKPTPPTTLLFVRHGKTPTTGTTLPGRAKGLHLASEGESQAEQAAQRIHLAFPQLTAIYTSPLERCRETSKPLQRLTGIKATVDKQFIECDFGDWTGAELKKLAKLPEWTVVQRNPSAFRFPNGESFLEMQGRMETGIEAIRRKHAGGIVAVFSHADPIKAALATALAVPLDNFQRISVSPCSVSVVLYGAGTPSVLAVNSVGDLGSLRPS